MEQDKVLRRERYFISPKYDCKYINRSITKFNKKDSLTEWLIDNSIFFGNAPNGGDYLGECRDKRLFNGLNGVLCEIKHTFLNKSRKPLSKVKKEKGYYFRIVRIRWMPANKDIPSELIGKLDNLQYKAPSKNDTQLIKDADNIFFRYL